MWFRDTRAKILIKCTWVRNYRPIGASRWRNDLALYRGLTCIVNLLWCCLTGRIDREALVRIFGVIIADPGRNSNQAGVSR